MEQSDQSSDSHTRRARELVEGNRERYPELLIEQMASAMREEHKAIMVSGWSQEFALVALRMVARAGKLKAVTDDERKVIEWVESNPRFRQPPPNRRLGAPFDGLYGLTADGNAQAVLFGEEAA